MTLDKRVAGILVTVFTAGLAGITISQTGGRSAPLFHARPVEAFYNLTHSDTDDASFCLTGAPRPSWPSPGEWENMAPEDRERVMRKFAEDRFREGLTNAGFTQDSLQDAAVDFLRIVEADRRSIREKGGRLRGAVADGSSDAQIATLMTDLRRAVADAKSRRDRGRKELNAKIRFTKKPKLDAILSLYGLGGDESAYLINSFGGRGFNRRGGNDNPR